MQQIRSSTTQRHPVDHFDSVAGEDARVQAWKAERGCLTNAAGAGPEPESRTSALARCTCPEP
jgi:hypothetical protein